MMVSTAPTSTVNITGFFHWMSGRSITSDCRKAAFKSSGSNKPAFRLCRRPSLSSSGVGPVMRGSVNVVFDIVYLDFFAVTSLRKGLHLGGRAAEYGEGGAPNTSQDAPPKR